MGNEVIFSATVQRPTAGEAIPGVPKSAFCVHEPDGDFRNVQGRCRVSHVGTGLQFADFRDDETACRYMRKWWRSLRPSAKKFVAGLTFNDVLLAMWRDSGVGPPSDISNGVHVRLG